MTSDDIWKPEEYHEYHKLVFRTMFNFLIEHFPPPDDPEWWKKFSQDMSAASDKVKSGPLADGMLLAIGDYMEEELMKRRDHNG